MFRTHESAILGSFGPDSPQLLSDGMSPHPRTHTEHIKFTLAVVPGVLSGALAILGANQAFASSGAARRRAAQR